MLSATTSGVTPHGRIALTLPPDYPPHPRYTGRGRRYYQSAFWGGKTKFIIPLLEDLKMRTAVDRKHNHYSQVIQDERYFNYYMWKKMNDSAINIRTLSHSSVGCRPSWQQTHLCCRRVALALFACRVGLPCWLAPNATCRTFLFDTRAHTRAHTHSFTLARTPDRRHDANGNKTDFCSRSTHTALATTSTSSTGPSSSTARQSRAR